MLHHDPALNPDTARDARGRWIAAPGTLIRNLTLAELGQYDVGRLRPGSDYAARYPAQIGRDGPRIPTLQALLEAQPACRFNIELKLIPGHPGLTVAPEVMTEAVLAVIDGTDAARRVTIQSFDWRAPRHVRHLRPDIARGWLTEAATIAAAPLWRGIAHANSTLDAVPDAIAEEGGGTWTPFYAELTPILLDRAHALDLLVIPWTVNDTEAMRRLIGWGVDGLITDRPDLASSVLP